MRPISQIQEELVGWASILTGEGKEQPHPLTELAAHIERLERIVLEVASGKRVKLQGTRMFDPEARNQPVDWPDLRDLLQELVGE